MSEPTPAQKARYNERWGLSLGACNCHHGSAKWCPVHTQADYDAQHTPTPRGVEAAVRALIEEAGGLCVVPNDPEDGICETHSELLFDGYCEDDPKELRAVLRILRDDK